MPKKRRSKAKRKKNSFSLSSAWKKLPAGTRVRKVGGMVQALIPQR